MIRTRHFIFGAILLTGLVIGCMLVVARTEVDRTVGVSFESVSYNPPHDVLRVAQPVDQSYDTNISALRRAYASYRTRDIGEVFPERIDTHISTRTVTDAVSVPPGSSCGLPSTRTVMDVSATNYQIVSLNDQRMASYMMEENATSVPHTYVSIPRVPTYVGHEMCADDVLIGFKLNGEPLYQDEGGVFAAARSDELIGYARDGFGIYGSDTDAAVNGSRDACGGHTHTIIWDEAPMDMYHYHIAQDTNTVLPCFGGMPTSVLIYSR